MMATRSNTIMFCSKNICSRIYKIRRVTTATSIPFKFFDSTTGIYSSPFKDIKFQPTSVYSLIFPTDKVQEEWARHPAFIETESQQILTYGQLLENAKALSTSMHYELGLQDGDAVLLYSANSALIPTVMVAGLRIGLSISPSNPLYQSSELAHQLRDSSTKALFTTMEGLDVARLAAAEAGLTSEQIIVMGKEKIDGYRTVEELIQAGKKRKEVPQKVYSTKDVTSGSPAFLCYSSGTTGLSKGVMTTHDNIAFNCAQTQSIDPISKETLMIATLPMYHIYCLQIVLIWGLWRKASIVVQPRFRLESFLEAIEKHKVTNAAVVPPIILKMAKDPVVEKYDLSSLKECVSAAAPLSKELSSAFEDRLGIRVKQAYGMTEMSPLSHYTPSAKIVEGSVGVLLPNCHAKILDVDGNPQPPGHEGELVVKGRMVMKGYLNNEQATRDAIDADGYLHTGDVAITADGEYFQVVDRLKELIKFNGFPVIPAELEALLLTHPDILDAAVVGVKDKSNGELPKAFVVLKAGSELVESGVQEFVAGKVAHYKQLRGGVSFIDEIPKSAAGKILRRFLRDKV